MKAQVIQAFESLPASATYRRIEFDGAQVVPGFFTNTYMLIVSGVNPWVTIDVRLVPLIYIDEPDFWGIEVTGCQSGIGLPQTEPYTVTLEVTHFIGKKGIEVLGASRTRKINVP